MQDLLALGSLVVLRFGIPGLVIAGAVYLLARQTKAQIQSDLHALPKGRSFTPSQWASAATVPPMVPCWEQKGCDAARRAACVAYTHAHVPCWLAVAVVEGQPRAGCQTCRLYTLDKREAPYLRVIKGRDAASGRTSVGEPACRGSGSN